MLGGGGGTRKNRSPDLGSYHRLFSYAQRRYHPSPVQVGGRAETLRCSCINAQRVCPAPAQSPRASGDPSLCTPAILPQDSHAACPTGIRRGLKVRHHLVGFVAVHTHAPKLLAAHWQLQARFFGHWHAAAQVYYVARPKARRGRLECTYGHNPTSIWIQLGTLGSLVVHL